MRITGIRNAMAIVSNMLTNSAVSSSVFTYSYCRTVISMMRVESFGAVGELAANDDPLAIKLHARLVSRA